MIKTDIKVSLNFPDINGKGLMKKIADDIIKKDIKMHIVGERNLSEQRYRPLAQSTKDRKAKLGLRPETLQATGLLRGSITSEFVDNETVRLFIRGIREKVAEHLQINGVKSKQFGGKRRFEFFGISKRAELKSEAFVFKHIDKAIKDGRRRFIKRFSK